MPVLSCTVTDCWTRKPDISSTKQNCRLVFNVASLLNQLSMRLCKYCCPHKDDGQVAEKEHGITLALYHGFGYASVDHPRAPLALTCIYGTSVASNWCINGQWVILWGLFFPSDKTMRVLARSMDYPARRGSLLPTMYQEEIVWFLKAEARQT